MKKQKKSVNKLDKYLRLTWRKLLGIVVLGFVSIILHNLIGGLFNIEEPVFFIIVIFIIPLYLIISVFYSLFKFIKEKKS
ncbi:MAG: hypothetical protein KJ721_00615 [Nanoarchaeota archaeon]|nr:hypothetical protein [Nanoarchaeota archaeon]